MKDIFVLIIIIFTGTTGLNAQPVAFPSAEGYGRIATGGRGTLVDGRELFLKAKVVEVTNLDDYDDGESPIEGSFRWALSQQDTLYNGITLKIPTTVVFRVGGVINLKRDIHTSVKHMTIAGQTAPGDGICFKGATLNFSGSENFIVRYIRSRPGDELGLETSAFRIENGKDFIIDHCSFSWAIEETTHFSSSPSFTVQWCIVSEGLYDSYHKKGPRGYGAQWGGEYSTYHHNLMATHNSRTPRINGSNQNDVEALVDYRNNVNYNWGRSGSFYGGEWMKTNGKGFAHTNIVKNYFIPGPGNYGELYFAAPGLGDNGYSSWYFDGNVMVGKESYTANNWLGVDVSQVGNAANIRSDEEFVKSDGVVESYERYTQSADEAYHSVMKYVGAIYPKRDTIDARVIAEAKGEIPLVRYTYIDDDGKESPVKGIESGIIDTPFNLVSPEDRGAGKDAWSGYKNSIPDQAPVDSDHDGMPDVWETEHQLNPEDGEDFRIITPSGYTYLEVYLSELVGDTIAYNERLDNSITEMKQTESINVFPNPFTNHACVKVVNHTSGNQKILLMDQTGKVIKTIYSGYLIEGEHRFNLDGDNLPDGIYFIMYHGDGASSVKKMIKW